MNWGIENTVALRHGFTLGDLHGVAQTAARTAGHAASDYSDRFDTAWSAIVEHLYDAEEPPTGHDLVGVGCNAIWRERRQELHCHGYTAGPNREIRMGPGFERFWRWHAPVTASPEAVVVDRLALRQIMPELTDVQREALLVYTATGYSVGQAAEALGVKSKTMSARVDYGRARFLELWHEGETPSRKWRKEGSRRPDDQLVQCGTESAYFRHWRRREPIDEACREAKRRAKAARKAAKPAECAA